MAEEYNQQSRGLESQLDEPRRTTEDVQAGDTSSYLGNGQNFENLSSNTEGTGYAGEEQGQGAGYGGVPESEPPHHKLHSSNEPLPQPTSGTYDDQPVREQNLDSTTGQGYDAPRSLDDTQGTTPQFGNDEGVGQRATAQAEPRSYGVGTTDTTNGSSQDDTTTGALGDAPVAGHVVERGYGYDKSQPGYGEQDTYPGQGNEQTNSGLGNEQTNSGFGNEQTNSGLGNEQTNSGLGNEQTGSTVNDEQTTAPKKESLITKLKEKLPGHHNKPAAGDQDTSLDEDTTTPPKKGLVAKIKEKLPGHHGTTDTVE